MAERGRPKGANGEESRALLLTIAANEFATNGYHKTKISTIVKRASLTQPTFYLYFKNKEAIFEELEDLFQFQLIEYTKKSRLQPGLTPTTAKERIIYGLQNFMEFLMKNPDLSMIGFYISNRATEVKASVKDQIKDNLDYEIQAGYFRQDLDTQLIAECLIGIIERLTFTQLLTKQKTPEQLANEIVNLLLYGMIESSVVAQLQIK